MSRALNDRKLFQRLLDGKAVKDMDGDLYWLGKDGNLVFAGASGGYVECNRSAFGSTHEAARCPCGAHDSVQAFFAARKPRSAK